MTVSVILVNYNSGGLLKECVQSLRNHVRQKLEIIVFDNASSDGSATGLGADVQVIASTENLGFARGCNLGARAAQGEVLHFLNPDTTVGSDINDAYRQAGEFPQNLLVTRVIDTHRKFESQGYPFPTLGNLVRLIFSPAAVKRWYVGASVIMSREVFQRLGGWSEEYFMYAEDTDLFYKASIAGISVNQSPAIVYHNQGGSTRAVWTRRQRLQRVENSALIFARKFNLVFSYFVFKHVAFAHHLFRSPREALEELTVYWKALLNS
jgi:hypothetical protein